MHEEIKKFALTGSINDEVNVVEAKERMVHFLETQMREQGHVPLLDMDPQYTQQFDPSNDEYEFILSVYGVYVGEDAAWDTAGVMSGKTITKSTLRPR